MNPNINSRFGLLCPSCQKKLINPNQPWPEPCTTCGQRTHLKCLHNGFTWAVDLDIDMDPNRRDPLCSKCHDHATLNLALIQQIPQASGGEPQDVYKRFVAQMPKTAKKPVTQLWGDYRVDPHNFVPAVTKVLDIVHSTGIKVRWSVKLNNWDTVPMTNLASKEIILPNYFDSPNALGRTHQEILDAMTGAAMHEAGHAAYDSVHTILEAQKRIKPDAGHYTWASATCLNIVCDYNLERKVIERYPAFKHYFQECHRWSVNDSLPKIVTALQQPDAEDQMNVRLGILVWEMLGPGDLTAAGAVITPKLKFIIAKCFDVLKYAYTKGLLNAEPGKLKTARALYELVRVVTPVGYLPPIMAPQPNQPPGNQGTQTIGGYPGQGRPTQSDDESQQPSQDGSEASEQESEQDTNDSHGAGRPGELPTGSGTDPGTASGDAGQDQDGQDQGPETDEDTQGSESQGDQDADGDGSSADTGSDGDDFDDDSTTGTGNTTGGLQDSETEAQEAGQGQGSEDDHDVGNSVYDDSGIADNTSPESTDAGDATPGVGPSVMGGKSGSEQPTDPANDPWTGAGGLQDDPTRRKNAKKDALDDLSEENANEDKVDVAQDGLAPLVDDLSFQPDWRKKSEAASNPPDVKLAPQPPDYQLAVLADAHTNRVTNLSPVISRLKKVLRFRNADWGGKQTGRRAGTLTRRHVARLSAFGSDKVFHKAKPDETPKVRIALIIDESSSMNGSAPDAPYIAAKNAATVLTEALHGIKGVKLWSWGFSLNRDYENYTNKSKQVPTLRAYANPQKPIPSSTLEVSPMNGGTPTGEAMDYAAEVISKNAAPNEKKVVFIITDGEAGGYVSTATAVRKWTGKVTFVHIGIGATVDTDIPYYIGPVTDVTLLPDLLSASVSEILT